MYFVCYIQLWIPSVLLVFNVGLAATEKGKARIRESLAVAICSSMKAFSKTKQVVGRLKSPQQFLVGATRHNLDCKICRHIRWKACNNCLKFSYVSCNNNAEEIFSGKNSSKSSRIVNGRDVDPNEFPFLVSLRTHGSGHKCGGSIYNKDWVITAAHCVTRAESIGLEEYYVMAGDRIVSIVEATEQKVNVKSVVIHEENGPDLLNDMALIQVSPSFELNSAVTPICLVSKTYELKVGQKVGVSGWGTLERQAGQVASDMAKTVDLRVVTYDECKAAYPPDFHNVTEDTVCATSLSSNPSGVCAGDSGGPLFIDNEDGSRFLVGVVSGTNRSNCGGPSQPSFYARITNFHDWVVSHAI